MVPQREGTAPKRNGRPGPIIRIVISLLIVWHFAAIFLAAMAVPGPTSQLVISIAEHPKSPMRCYLDALYLNQGHSFFAPDVGPGHFIRYELSDQSNRVIATGTLPDKKEHWPRLWYHRHMMLADQVEMAGDNPQLKRMVLEAFARHLLRTNKDAQVARVLLVAHYPLPTEFLLANGREQGYPRYKQELARFGNNRSFDNQGFELVGEATQRRSDLGPEISEQSLNANPNLNWQTERVNVAGRWNGGTR